MQSYPHEIGLFLIWNTVYMYGIYNVFRLLELDILWHLCNNISHYGLSTSSCK